jgi:transcription initiation factor IIE alpha subunit
LDREAVFDMLRQQFHVTDEFLNEQLGFLRNDLRALIRLFD